MTVAVTTPAGTINISLSVADKTKPIYRATDGSYWVAGQPGKPYTIHVTNLTSTRAEVIVTIDGRHVLKDEPGDAHANQGFVIPALGSYEFTGWRVDDEGTRQFVFGVPSRSVAAQAGSPENTGVIGFAAWRESSPWREPVYGSSSAAVASAAPSGAAIGDWGGDSLKRGLGTGIGEHRADPVSHTSFARTGNPDILVIGYDTAEALARMGIPGPQAFPGVPTGYAAYKS